MAAQAMVKVSLPEEIALLARGKVRDLYDVDNDKLLFVASDRISAFDVVLDNGVPGKGRLLTSMSAFWFAYLAKQIPGLRTHLLHLGIPESFSSRLEPDLAAALAPRSMVVKRLKVVQLESIVRGYLTGSAWSEYKRSSTVHGIDLPPGLKESQRIPAPYFPFWTPSTKAPPGEHDENIHPDKAADIVGAKLAKEVADLSIRLYSEAHEYALSKGIIIADTKFEFGVDAADGAVVLADEVLTPDSSRFWPLAKYEVGRGQDSFDKQPLRDWLTNNGLKGKDGVAMPAEVVARTAELYDQVAALLTQQ